MELLEHITSSPSSSSCACGLVRAFARDELVAIDGTFSSAGAFVFFDRETSISSVDSAFANALFARVVALSICENSAVAVIFARDSSF